MEIFDDLDVVDVPSRGPIPRTTTVPESLTAARSSDSAAPHGRLSGCVPPGGTAGKRLRCRRHVHLRSRFRGGCDSVGTGDVAVATETQS